MLAALRIGFAFNHLVFRSYVQSKGRARAKPSEYILMMSDVDYLKSHKKYEEYRNMEELSLRECHLRPFAESEGAWDKLECDEVYEADPGDPGTARITGSQAVRLVHKYIQRIKVDRFTRLTPVWVTETPLARASVG